MAKLPRRITGKFKAHNSDDQEIINTEPVAYTDGAEGFFNWCEDLVYVPIYPYSHKEGELLASSATWCPMAQLPRDPHPVTGRSYYSMWEEQKKIFREALRMENGQFVYRLIALCWPRGEGKSLGVVLIQLWKFFCWDRQLIALGANSRDQVKFVHYDMMRDIIINSPGLRTSLANYKRDIQEKEIRQKDRVHQTVTSMIRSISSFSGIVSNITGYTFSEIFDMKNPRFFVQLDGSIRNIPNALGTIDSTVSAKDHVLYQLYSNCILGKLKEVYFSYRYSTNGDYTDYWNPNMTAAQLNDYKYKFPFGEFERYFLNLWSAGTITIFTSAMIDELGVMECDGVYLNHKETYAALEKKEHFVELAKSMEQKGFGEAVEECRENAKKQMNRLTPVDDFYTLTDAYGQIVPVTLESLSHLGDVLETNWAILAGLDFADPMALRKMARSIMVILAKGLPGSSEQTQLYTFNNEIAPKYVYFLLYCMMGKTDSVNDIKVGLDMCHEEYDGIDSLCSERYGSWDLSDWCEDRDIIFKPIYPTYDRQKEGFGEVYNLFQEGRIKSPFVPLPGSKKEDIFREELSIFDHDPDARWFGSPEKNEKKGTQDDFIYAINWGIYGGKEIGVNDFRIRRNVTSFGEMFLNKTIVGKY